MSKKVIVSDRSSITAGQWQEFWKKVELRQVTSENFQDYLDDPGQFSDGVFGLSSLSQAKKILGYRRVLTVANFNLAWNVQQQKSPIKYSVTDLKLVARRNEIAGEDWRLVYYSGRSASDLYYHYVSIINRKNQPYFKEMSNNLHSRGCLWPEHLPLAGYYLINFKGLFSNFDYQQQTEAIKTKFGQDFERTNAHVLTEVAMTIFILTGERIVEKWFHRAVCIMEGVYHHFGFFGSSGWTHNQESEDGCFKDVCVSISQNQRELR
ncbi:MAG: hypothetical protein WC458_00545 [Patescibacteria group bacterium]